MIVNSCAKNLEPAPQDSKTSNNGPVIQPLQPGETLVKASRSQAFHIYNDGVYSSTANQTITVPEIINAS